MVNNPAFWLNSKVATDWKNSAEILDFMIRYVRLRKNYQQYYYERKVSYITCMCAYRQTQVHVHT